MKTPTHNPTPGTLHAPCTYASMQSVLVKIASPAQSPAPCDQPTARVRARVDLCLDLLAKVLRSATVRSAILREENRVSHGLPARVVASCTVPAADVRGREEEHRSSLRGSLRLASSCEVHAAIGGTGLPAPRSASCERCRASCNRASAHAWPRCCELQDWVI